MNAKLTRIHLGLGMSESGVQFELDDGAGGTVRQRAFLVLPDDAMAAVWAAAQTALASKLGDLPVDMPPGAVTSALMQARNAQQEAAKARAAQLDAEAARARAQQDADAAESARKDHEQAVAEKRRELADLEKELAARRSEADASEEPSP